MVIIAKQQSTNITILKQQQTSFNERELQIFIVCEKVDHNLVLQCLDSQGRYSACSTCVYVHVNCVLLAVALFSARDRLPCRRTHIKLRSRSGPPEQRTNFYNTYYMHLVSSIALLVAFLKGSGWGGGACKLFQQ